MQLSPHMYLALVSSRDTRPVSSPAGLGTPLDKPGLGTPAAIKMPGRSGEDKVGRGPDLYVIPNKRLHSSCQRQNNDH